ncbi:MAG: ATP-binding cassette domain-containing protein [Rubrivivax sp.]|nr:ATP-binding cassette domain-containing protein [Rubrivivax sp.]
MNGGDSGSAAEGAAPTWDIAVAKVLRHGQTRFELDVRFTSAARRVVVYGPSGAGKTLTLRMIAGITQPDRGRIAVAGHVLGDSAAGHWLAPRERHLAYMFQDYALFPHLTVRQNIAFARRRGWRNPDRNPGRNPRPDSADAAVERWIATFHLAPVAAHYPHQLSGGQRQRTALARALVSEPRALLLDEPFAALDTGLRRRLRQELLELQQQLGLPMMVITHDEEEVRVLAEQVIPMHAGRVVLGMAPGDIAAAVPA